MSAGWPFGYGTAPDYPPISRTAYAKSRFADVRAWNAVLGLARSEVWGNSVPDWLWHVAKADAASRSAAGVIDEETDCLHPHSVFRSFKPEPADYLLRQTSHCKAIASLCLRRAEALSRRQSPTA